MRWGIVGMAVALAACVAPASIGAVCIRSSECDESLVCATGVCRAQCGDSRDCVNAASCVTYHGAGVCVPPSTPVPCIFDTDCGALFCRSGQCVQQCVSDHDCAAGACLNSFCTRPAMTPAMPGDAGPTLADGGGMCASGSRVCSGTSCTDVMTDPMNCGACSAECATNERCVGGQCLCDSPRTTCAIDCVDLMTDGANCGACSVACSGACSAGHCCPVGQIYCGSACVDASIDGNCGACGVSCMTGWQCREAGCRAPADTCAAPLAFDVGDGTSALSLGMQTDYLDDVACSGASTDLFTVLTASTPTITLVDPIDSRWSDLGATCDGTSVVCGVGACLGTRAEVITVLDATPRYYAVEVLGTGPAQFYAVAVGDLPTTRAGALPITATVSAPWGSGPTGCGTGQANVVYTFDCAIGSFATMPTSVTVRACDPTGAPVTLAVRRRAEASLCGNVDPGCPGGATVTLDGLTSGPLADGLLVMFVGHVSASDTGPITLTATVP